MEGPYLLTIVTNPQSTHFNAILTFFIELENISYLNFYIDIVKSFEKNHILEISLSSILYSLYYSGWLLDETDS